MNAPALIEPTLDQLATEINAAHAAAQALSSQAVERAHDAGIWLNQAKAQVEHGQWLPWLAAGMAACNIAGDVVGTRLALRHGSRLVRHVFLAVVALLIVRFAWDTFA